MPMPLSATFIADFPASTTSMIMFVAFASMLFSMHSLIIELGLSITSPAAILFIKSLSSCMIFAITTPS
jgi:hypothetical protein